MYVYTYITAFTDGRDVSPHAAVDDLAELPADRIATIAGRYYAMDRDGRWERTDLAFDAMLNGTSETAELVLSGSYSVRKSANAAANTNNAMMAAPAAPSG